ncbi:MAG: hypothetical protein JRD89_20765 [Deltaproteobacteria bacterium]|nr:hypothetical protein [Deltaproteobacteria bacterium]
MDAVYFTYFFMEPNKRRDPSNFTSGGIKIIEDALQSAGILKNDGWRNVLGISSYWTVDKDCPGVMLYMTDFRLSEDEADTVLLQIKEGDDD